MSEKIDELEQEPQLTQEEITTHDVVARPVDTKPSRGTGVVFVLTGVLVVLLMTVWRGPADTTTFRFSDSGDLF